MYPAVNLRLSLLIKKLRFKKVNIWDICIFWGNLKKCVMIDTPLQCFILVN